MLRAADESVKKNLKQLREAEKQEKEQALREKCEAIAIERYTKDEVLKWSNKYKGLWYLPVLDENEEIQLLAVMRPIDRYILSHATTKIEEEGLYVFLEQCMRDCWVAGDEEILNDEEIFIPAAQKFNKIMEGKKVAFLKR